MQLIETSRGHVPHMVNPALLDHARERRESFENRLADRITTFSGSMRFVYLHVAWFAISRQILDLTRAVHHATSRARGRGGAQ